MPNQIPKPTYEVQLFTATTDPIPNMNIKQPNTICAMAKPRRAEARYTMITHTTYRKATTNRFA